MNIGFLLLVYNKIIDKYFKQNILIKTDERKKFEFLLSISIRTDVAINSFIHLNFFKWFVSQNIRFYRC